MMITSTTTDIRAACTVHEMREIARNQIRFKIYELEDRIDALKTLSDEIDSIRDWESYQWIARNVIDMGDDSDCPALHELGEYFDLMVEGGYF